MKRYETDDELINLQIRLRHETLPICPPQPVVELPDGSHELDAPVDVLRWQDTAPLPVVPTQRSERRWWLPVACIVPTLAVAGDLVGRWL